METHHWSWSALRHRHVTAFIELSRCGVPTSWHSRWRRHLVALFCIVCLWQGCTEVAVQRGATTSAGISPRDGLTAMLHFYRDMPVNAMEKAERKISDCIADGVRAAKLDARVVPPDEFRRVAFPGLLFEEIPRSPESLIPLVAHPGFQERIVALHLRYLVIVTGGTAERETFSEGGCAPPGGCIALRVVDRRSHLGALIVDVKQARTVEELRVEASGHPWIAIIGILPVGLPAFTKHRACEEFGDTVAKAIANPVSALSPPSE